MAQNEVLMSNFGISQDKPRSWALHEDHAGAKGFFNLLAPPGFTPV